MEIETLIGQVGIGGGIAVILVMWLTQSFTKRIDVLSDSNKDLSVAIAGVGNPNSLSSEIRSMKEAIVASISEMKEEFIKSNGGKRR